MTTVGQVMSLNPRRLPATTTVAAVARFIAAGGVLPLPIVDEAERLVAAVSEHEIMSAVETGADMNDVPVTAVAATTLPTARTDTPLEETTGLMERSGEYVVLVLDDARLVGTLTSTDVEAQALVEAELGPAAGAVSREISANDLMYAGSWGAYAYAGVTAAACVRDLLEKLGRKAPRSILNLPCGHGRELRFMKPLYPDARFTACDVDRDGVEFCARTFGSRPIFSNDDPARVTFGARHELAWCGSLFTHLSPGRWQGFLELFARALEPGGLLLFSTNGLIEDQMLQNLGLTEQLAGRLSKDFERAGIGYVDVTDSWGLSMARPAWVERQIERSPLELVSFERGAWKPPFPAQDVFACTLPER